MFGQSQGGNKKVKYRTFSSGKNVLFIFFSVYKYLNEPSEFVKRPGWCHMASKQHITCHIKTFLPLFSKRDTNLSLSMA